MDDDDPRLTIEGEIALQVRSLCQLYGGSAESVGSGELDENDEIGVYEQKRYEKGRDEALKLAITLKDEFYQNTALHAAFDYCMKAKDFTFAIAIAKAITLEVVQDSIVGQHGDHFVLNERDGRLHPTAIATIGPLLK